jgi:hypothetical protein
MTYLADASGWRRPYSVPPGYDLKLDPVSPYRGNVLIEGPWEFYIDVRAHKDFASNLALAERITRDLGGREL